MSRIWVIGASSGIGRALAIKFGQDPKYELILSARDATALAEVAKMCQNARILPLDLGDSAAFAASCMELAPTPIDVIINAAALYEPSPVQDIDPEFLDRLIAVNLTAMFHLAKAAPTLLRQGGQLVLFGSVAGYFGLPKGQPYSATKAAVINLAETLRVELAPKVDVRLVSPGFVKTRLTAKNEFKMPGIIPPEEAADAVIAGLRGSKFEIHFPKRFTYAIKLLRALPYWAALALTARIGKKG